MARRSQSPDLAVAALVAAVVTWLGFLAAGLVRKAAVAPPDDVLVILAFALGLAAAFRYLRKHT